MNKLIASWFGVGYIKGGGTIAAAITCVLVYFFWQVPAGQNIWLFLAITIIINAIGIYVGNQVEPFWGKDSYRVVIDEVGGMLVALLFIHPNTYALIGGFVLFRFFDMVKPLYIRKMENLPAGTGVMMDDILAGVYSNIVLQILLLIFK